MSAATFNYMYLSKLPTKAMRLDHRHQAKVQGAAEGPRKGRDKIKQHGCIDETGRTGDGKSNAVGNRGGGAGLGGLPEAVF